MASSPAESNGGSEHTEALYREHGAAVAALCRSLLRDRGEAEDAAQQVFLSAHRALLTGTVPREPLAWLLAVARNECYGRFRQRAATPVPAGEASEGATEDASVHALRAGELARLWDEVAQMPRAQREAFLLREIRGLSYGQLAAELSLSRPSVRSLLLRARNRLRRRLGDVAAGLGGAQWVQALVRVVSGGDGPSPVPAATKAVAVGLGALALAGGSSRALPRVVHHAPTPRGHAAARHRSEPRVRRVATPTIAAAVLAPREDRSSEQSTRRDGGSGGSRSRGGGDDTVVAASGTSTAEGIRDGSGSSGGSDDTTTTPTTTTTTQSSSSSGSDGGTSGRDAGSDGGAASVTPTTSSGPDGSSSTDGGATTATTTTSDGHDGSGGSE
jgi:RNA polymerase sigma-70 factor (ECF subfamily)